MQIDALVVGAGPVGMTMALELHRQGLSCRIIDVAAAPTIYSKAQVVHARTLEIFDDMKVLPAMLPRGKKLRGVNIFEGERSIAHLALSQVDSPWPFTLCIAQRDTELVLEEALRERGCAVERKVKLDRFQVIDGGIEAVLIHDPEGVAREETVRTAWMLGCDGAHSTVRTGLGLELVGSTYEFRLIQADVRVDFPMEVADAEITAFLHPDGPLAFFPLPGEKRYRQLAFLQPGVEIEPTLEGFQAVAAKRGRADIAVSDPAWMVGFKIHARLAPRLRVGRVLLAGDSAHIHSPAGGQGMNMGIQDAYNLAWKLALVHKGVGKDVVLDSYEAERRPIHEVTLGATDAATRRGSLLVGVKNRVVKELRNQILGFAGSLGLVQGGVARALSMLDVSYKSSPIVAQHRGSFFSTSVMADRSTEAPCLEDWLEFGDGPEPGLRTFDAPVLGSSDEGETAPESLFDLFGSTHHTLLLFDGAASTDVGYKNLERIAQQTQARCGKHVVTHVVVPFAERPSALTWTGSILFDEDGALHRRYGARSECLYVVRPDGHIAYRCQPADPASLAQYWDTIFR